MAERSKASDSSSDLERGVGSNPTATILNLKAFILYKQYLQQNVVTKRVLVCGRRCSPSCGLNLGPVLTSTTHLPLCNKGKIHSFLEHEQNCSFIGVDFASFSAHIALIERTGMQSESGQRSRKLSPNTKNLVARLRQGPRPETA